MLWGPESSRSLPPALISGAPSLQAQLHRLPGLPPQQWGRGSGGEDYEEKSCPNPRLLFGIGSRQENGNRALS